MKVSYEDGMYYCVVVVSKTKKIFTFSPNRKEAIRYAFERLNGDYC